MDDEKELVVIKILSELQNKYNINNLEVKEILDRNLSKYTLLSNSTDLMVSDLPEKIHFFLGLKTLEGLSELSIERYQEELNMFSRYILKPVNQIDINDLRSYLAIIQTEKHYEKITLNGKMAVLRSFFGTLYREEIIPKDPSIRLKNLKVNVKELREPLEAEEVEKLRNACKDIREKSIIEVAVSTGCRVSEMLKIKLKEINWNENSILIHGKGGKNRSVYFSVKCKLYLQEYIEERKGTSEFLFLGEREPYSPLTKSGIEKIFKRIANRTDIVNNVSPHILRHNFCTDATRRIGDITIVAQLMGHSSSRTTEIYNKVNQNFVKNAYQQYLS